MSLVQDKKDDLSFKTFNTQMIEKIIDINTYINESNWESQKSNASLNHIKHKR